MKLRLVLDVDAPRAIPSAAAWITRPVVVAKPWRAALLLVSRRPPPPPPVREGEEARPRPEPRLSSDMW